MSGLKVADGVPKPFDVVPESSETVIAIIAEQAARTVASMAMVNRKSRQLTAPHHIFRRLADSAQTALVFVERFVLAVGKAIFFLDVNPMTFFGPLFFCKTGSPCAKVLRASSLLLACGVVAARILYKVFYPIVFRIVQIGSEKLRRRRIKMIKPNGVLERHALVPANINVTFRDYFFAALRFVAASGVPISGDLSYRCPRTPWPFAPSKGQRLGRVVNKKFLNFVLANFTLHLRRSFVVEAV